MRHTATGEKHFTSSVLLLSDETPQRVLLLHHKKLRKWVQLGGHIEHFENPIEAAIREAKEESGIDITPFIKRSDNDYNGCSFLQVPTHIMEEEIPPYKDEPMHYHLDLLYVFTIPYQAVIPQDGESQEIGWFTLGEALKLPIFKNTVIILTELMQSS